MGFLSTRAIWDQGKYGNLRVGFARVHALKAGSIGVHIRVMFGRRRQRGTYEAYGSAHELQPSGLGRFSMPMESSVGSFGTRARSGQIFRGRGFRGAAGQKASTGS